MTQGMKSGKNHTPTPYDETNEIKKSLETLTKIQQNNNETPNKDIINIENNIRNISKELAKQANQISEQIKSFEKTDSFVKELKGTVGSLADNGSLWFIVGKNGIGQKPSESTKKLQEGKKSEQFQLLVFWDSIMKNVSPSAIIKCNEIQAVNYSTGGSKI